MRSRFGFGLLALLCALALIGTGSPASAVRKDPRLAHSYRLPKHNNWIFVHLQGTPSEIGFQNGYWLEPEILDLERTLVLEKQHTLHKKWSWFREQAKDVMWPKIYPEYQQEMQGIAEGVDARGGKLDVWDIVAMNALEEWSYYVEQYNKVHGDTNPPAALQKGDHCSAFVAVGDWTRGGKIVMSHNNWSSYLEGARWNIIYDIVPTHGYQIVMDGLPGVIHSGDDFGVNSDGIMITETTISDFHGYDFQGIPEFARAREAMQYASSIADYAKIMEKGNNGGYANDWLVGDRKNNEIASLELGLKVVTLQTSKNGFFVSSNFPINPKLTREETTFNTHDPANSENARHTRWLQLMAQYKGRIDADRAEKFESDDYDVILKKISPDERSLNGHGDLTPRGAHPYNDSGAVQSKAIDSALAAKMSFWAASGHSDGIGFTAATWLKAHPQYAWQKPVLIDMPSYPWTLFHAGER